MPLFRVTVSHEFCIDAANEAEVLAIFEREHVMAISEDRCAIIEGPEISVIESEGDLDDRTLNEVPLNAFDLSVQERLNRGY